MLAKSILTAIAIALVAGLGSASADENFSTIADLSAQPLSAHELAKVRGTHWRIFTPGSTIDLSEGICLFGECGDFEMNLVVPGGPIIEGGHGTQ